MSLALFAHCRHRSSPTWWSGSARWLLIAWLLSSPLTGGQLPPPSSEDLARLDWPSAQASGLRSSICPEGCRYDRHGPGQERVLRREGDEAVLFEAKQAGAITRIWMTTGKKAAQPLPDHFVLLIRVDGQILVEEKLSAFFAGRQPAFAEPGVLDLQQSGGGNVCHIPIVYRDSCSVSIRGLDQELLWFQFHFIEDLPGEDAHVSSHQESFAKHAAAWSSWLARLDQNPWPSSPAWHHREILIKDQAQKPQLSLQGGGWLEGLRIESAPAILDQLMVRIIADGTLRMDLPLVDLVGDSSTRTEAANSLMVRRRPDRVTLFWPMPFRQALSIEWYREDGVSTASDKVHLAYRWNKRKPHQQAGYFTALPFAADSRAGQPLDMFEQTGRGKWVGLRLRLDDPAAAGLDILEGDEQIFIDGAAQPSHHGTGVEDFFGGGFFFRKPSHLGSVPQPFQTALHGLETFSMTEDRVQLIMNRTFIADAVSFKKSLRIGLEGGPTGQLPLQAKGVAFFYLAD